MKNLNSKRLFIVTFIEGDDSFTKDNVSLELLLSNDNSEWIYACQEEIDNILDLKVGERFVMNFNRDNADSLGMIKRIK